MVDHELPAWHSTFSANADVATSTAYARGELDLLTVDLLRGAIDVLLLAGHHHIRLDLTEVSSIDAAGIKFLDSLQHRLDTQAGELTVINAPPPISPAASPGPETPRP